MIDHIGVGAGPAGPVLAGPIFRHLMKFIIDTLKNGAHETGPL